MGRTSTRRQFCVALAAGATVIAFDPERRTWITPLHAKPASSVPIPSLDGELTMDPAALAEAADDFGHIVHRTPIAVLRPGSAHDIKKLVEFANAHGLRVAMRGQGHATFGQAQVEAGVVIDSRTLAAIDSVAADGAWVEPGVRWIDLLGASLPLGLVPPVLTDFIELSVGGTCSVGGIGGGVQRHGLQVDNVLELEVVTGDGHQRKCSPHTHADLFESVLGGLGQFAIITRVKVRLVPATTNVRVYRIFYADLGTYLDDQRACVTDERFDYLEGQVVPAPSGGWMFMLEAAAYYTPPAFPDDALLLSGLTLGAGPVIEEHGYFDWQNRLAPTIEFLRQVGAWALPHPWIDLFLPDSQTESFVGFVLSTLTTADTGGGPMLLYPFKRSRLGRPFVSVPTEETLFLFDILRFAPPVPAIVDAMLAHNRALFEQARALGGKHYPIGSIALSPEDWVAHYGPAWPLFAARKHAYDPRFVLTPGQGIFTPT